MKAAIKIGSSQYLVSSGQELTVDRIASDTKKLVFDQVLLVIDDKQVQIGKPFLSQAKVTAEVIDQVKGPKIRVSKFKAKSRYRKTIGFRASQTKLKILDISSPTA